jgi:hypothetical protein
MKTLLLAVRVVFSNLIIPDPPIIPVRNIQGIYELSLPKYYTVATNFKTCNLTVFVSCLFYKFMTTVNCRHVQVTSLRVL